MLASQAYWKDLSGWTDDPEQGLATDLLLYFGSRDMLAREAQFPAATRKAAGSSVAPHTDRAAILVSCEGKLPMSERAA